MTLSGYDDVDIDLPALRSLLEGDTFAAWVRAIGLQLTHALPGEVELSLPVTPQHLHGGGTLCGQTMMAAADTAMALAICTLTDGYQPMTTVQLQTSFLRPIAGDAGAARVTARVLRKGRNLVFGEIEVADPKGALAAHATATYALS